MLLGSQYVPCPDNYIIYNKHCKNDNSRIRIQPVITVWWLELFL